MTMDVFFVCVVKFSRLILFNSLWKYVNWNTGEIEAIFQALGEKLDKGKLFVLFKDCNTIMQLWKISLELVIYTNNKLLFA